MNITPDEAITTEVGGTKDDWKWQGQMYQKFWNDHGLSQSKVDELLNKMSWAESGQRNIAQDGSGHAKGYYQMESLTASGSFQTALNSYLNVTGQRKNPPKWVLEARKHDDARRLSLDQQSEVALAAIYQDTNEGGSDKRLKAFKNNEPGALRELWLNNWWKDTKAKPGETKQELEIRLDKKRDWFDGRIQNYESKKSGTSFEDIVFDKIFEKDLFA